MTDLEIAATAGLIAGVVGAALVLFLAAVVRAYLEHRWAKRQHNTDFLSEWK